MRSKWICWLNKYWIYIAAGLIALLYTLITRWGPIVGFDSYYYLASAQGIRDGLGIGWLGADGVFVPLTHYPPLYPLLVAFISFVTGTSILQAARILVVLSVFSAVLCTGWLIQRQTRSWFFTALGMAFFIIPGLFMTTLVSAMSECLFLALFCGFLLLLSDDWKTNSTIRTGIQLALIAAMILVRFAAAAVLGAYLIFILLDRQNTIIIRIKTMVLAGLAAFIPLGLWLWTRAAVGDVTGRSLLFHPPGQNQYRLAWETIQTWFVPEWNRLGVPTLARVGLILIAAGVILFLIRSTRHPVNKTEHQEPSSLTRFLAVYLVIYPIFLWLSYSLMDASTRWTTRILSPWLFSLMLFMLVNFSKFVQLTRSRLVNGVLLAGVMIWGGAQLLNTSNQARIWITEGDGFTARAFQQSELLENIRQMDRSVMIYTNNTAVIYFNTGILSWSIPEKMDTIQSLPNTGYENQMGKMKTEILADKAIMVIFRPYDDKNGVYPDIDELSAQLSEGYKSKEGIIFQ